MLSIDLLSNKEGFSYYSLQNFLVGGSSRMKLAKAIEGEDHERYLLREYVQVNIKGTSES